jgi:hypothetical protein
VVCEDVLRLQPRQTAAMGFAGWQRTLGCDARGLRAAKTVNGYHGRDRSGLPLLFGSLVLKVPLSFPVKGLCRPLAKRQMHSCCLGALEGDVQALKLAHGWGHCNEACSGTRPDLECSGWT